MPSGRGWARAPGSCPLANQSEAAQIIVAPAGIGDDAAKRPNRERVAEASVWHNYSATVEMRVNVMAAPDSIQIEAVTTQGSDKPARERTAWRSEWGWISSVHTLTVNAARARAASSDGMGRPSSSMDSTYTPTAS